MARRVSRAFCVLSAVLALTFLVACSSRKPDRRFSQKLVILGFDGMDPALVARWMSEGQLPNMAKLASQGGLHPLATTHSPESPTAWASFATGVNPGKHNIYDFLVRDTNDLPARSRNGPARAAEVSLRLLSDRQTSKCCRFAAATSFWVTAGRAGVRSSVLTVPGDLPARGRAQRRAARRPSAARHPRHDGHLLLLRDRSEPLRRRQHRVRRHPEAPGDGERRRAHGARRTAEPARSGRRSRRFGRKGRTLDRRRSHRRSRSCRRRRTSGFRSPSRWNRAAKTASIDHRRADDACSKPAR